MAWQIIKYTLHFSRILGIRYKIWLPTLWSSWITHESCACLCVSGQLAEIVQALQGFEKSEWMSCLVICWGLLCNPLKEKWKWFKMDYWTTDWPNNADCLLSNSFVISSYLRRGSMSPYWSAQYHAWLQEVGPSGPFRGKVVLKMHPIQISP